MIHMDWYAWPIATILGIALLGMGTRKALASDPKLTQRFIWAPEIPLLFLRKLGWLEIATALTFLIPVIILRDETTFLALIGTVPASILSVINLKICVMAKSIARATLPASLAVASVTLVIILIQ